jgi:hypothetical protein
MDPLQQLPQPSATGEQDTVYQSHGFSTIASPMGTPDASFLSEQSQQQYDYDNSHGEDDGMELPEEEALPEIETAYSEARARGLPDGWTCSIDVRESKVFVAFLIFRLSVCA